VSSSLPLSTVIETLDGLWPPAGAEEWDAVGLVVGARSQQVTHIRLVVDVVRATVDEAIADGADVIVAHHPLLLRGVTSVAEDHYKGALVADLIRAGVGLYSAHTNADAVDVGTSEVLVRALGIAEMSPITEGLDENSGIGRVGVLPQPIRLYDLATTLGRLVPQTAGGIRVSGDPEQMVSRVALCTGAGDSLLHHPLVQGADVYITGDLRHHPVSEVQQQRLHESGPALIDVSHFASEWFFLDQVKAELEARLPGVTISVSEVVTDPWDFVIHPS
jgi:dinuclear metal center YbgI/SA1388 family protein